MPFQVYIFEYVNGRSGRGRGAWHLDLDEEGLRTRIVDPWERGVPITYNGETSDSTKSSISIWETSTNQQLLSDTTPSASTLDVTGTRVTNDWIKGHAGWRTDEAATLRQAASQSHVESPLRDHRRVMVVHGRNHAARDAMFTFLRALGLSPLEWEQAVAETGMGSPHNLDAVRAAMDVGQAVVVLLTAEDRAGILPELAGEDAEDVALRGQPRQNVILEAGLAMGVDRARTILVEIGPIRRASDFDGLNAVRLTNASGTRNALRTRLITAGCTVDESMSDWMTSGAGGDFENVAIPWEMLVVDG